MAALVALNAVLAGLTAYSINIGSGALEPLGTSLTVSLYSATAGRKTTGRHYLPWIADAIDDGNGRVVSTAPAQIEDAYDAFILGQTNATYTGITNLLPCVHSTVAGDTLIVTPRVSLNFARLKTRTR